MRTFGRLGVSLAALVMAGGTLAACGSTSSTSSKPAPSPKAEITKSYTEFFSGSSPAKTKIELLQHGSAFKQIIDAQASSPLARSAKAKVQKVTLTSSTTAKVLYTIYLGGEPALKNQTGQAVKVDGHWEVGDGSFCALLALQGEKNLPMCPSGAAS
jgi:hypothetical protein